MIQMRPQGGGLAYAPYRDLVNCFSSMARKVVLCLEPDQRVQWLNDFLSRYGVDDDKIGEAVVALAEYINQCRKSELADPMMVLEACGFTKVDLSAQTAIFALLGQVTLAMFYACSRDSLRSDEKPFGLDELLISADRVSSALRKPEITEAN